MNEFKIPSDEDLEKQLLELHEKSHFQIHEELHGIDWFSFFSDEIEN